MKKYKGIDGNAMSKPQYKILVTAMKNQIMKLSDILLLYNIPNTTSNRNTIYRMIDVIGNHFPVYEPIPGQYKILGPEDFDEYNQLYETQKNVKEMKQKWQPMK